MLNNVSTNILISILFYALRASLITVPFSLHQPPLAYNRRTLSVASLSYALKMYLNFSLLHIWHFLKTRVSMK